MGSALSYLVKSHPDTELPSPPSPNSITSENPPQTYSISSSETSNQLRHWKSRHFDHYFAHECEPALREQNKTDEEIEEAKLREKGMTPAKKQLVITAMLGVGALAFSDRCCVVRF